MTRVRGIVSVTSFLPAHLDVDKAYVALPANCVADIDGSFRFLRIGEFYGVLRLNNPINLVADVSMAAGGKLSASIAVGSGCHITIRGGAAPADFPPPASISSASSLRFVSVSFNNGVVDDAILNDTCFLRRMGDALFLGESFPLYRLELRSSEAYLPLFVRGSYFGLGIRSAPAGGKLAVLGKNGAVVKGTAGLWAIVQVREIVALHALGNIGDAWEVVNPTEWNDGEVPAFAKEVSTNFSPKVWRVLAAPTAGLPLRLTFRLPVVPFRVFHTKNTTNIAAKVVDSQLVVLEIPQSTSYRYDAYTALSETVTVMLDGATAGVLEIDVDALQRNLYPNYSRVVGMLGGLGAVLRIRPNYLALPQEGYVAYLNGNLQDMVAAANRIAFLSRSLAGEGIALSAALDYTFCIPLLVEKALVDALGAGYAIRVLPANGVYYVNIFCATQEAEAIALARAASLLNSIRGVLEPLLGESVSFTLKVLHRLAPPAA